MALTGLIASFHTILFAQGRQIFSLSRAGYFPSALSVTHPVHKTPHIAMIAGAVVGLTIMIIMWFALGGETAGSLIGSVLLNMAVFGAMLSYIAQAVSFILLRKNQPNMERPYRSPFGIPGAVEDANWRGGTPLAPVIPLRDAIHLVHAISFTNAWSKLLPACGSKRPSSTRLSCSALMLICPGTRPP